MGDGHFSASPTSVSSRRSIGAWRCHALRAVQILATEGELSVSELVTRLHISQPLMSWHLRG